MPYTREDFEKMLTGSGLPNAITKECMDLAVEVFSTFAKHDAQPAYAIAACSFCVGLMMGVEGKELETIYPIIKAAHALGVHDRGQIKK